MKRRAGHNTPLCFAAPAYANSVPLAQFIPEVCPGAGLLLDHPAELVERLLDGRVDAALMPVADLFAHPDLDMIHGLGVCADGLVRSVLLKCNRPMHQVCTLRPDKASHTSNALTRVLLKHHWKRTVRLVAASDPAPADAEVMIGDRALCSSPAPAGDYDLATEWKTMTGLPFVFAVWAFRRDHPESELLADVVHQAKAAGLTALPELIHQQSVKLGLDVTACREYFTTCIRYDLGARELEAMRRFRDFIKEDGITTQRRTS